MTKYLIILAGIILNSPHTAGAADCPPNASPDRISASLGHEQLPGRPEQVLVSDGGDIRTLYFADSNGRAVFEGDIILGKTSDIISLAKGGPIMLSSTADAGAVEPFALMARKVLSGATKWTNGVIPFDIAPNTPGESEIHRAMDTWSSSTGIKFVPRTNANSNVYKNYIHFETGTDPNACYSETLGMKGGEQYVDLVQGCEYGQILHELGHVIGLDHEQNRSDRSKFVTINFQNIWPQYAYAFVQSPKTEVDIGGYDYDSIMHYERDAFSCNGKFTIEAKTGQNIGQRDHLSVGDIAAVKKAYNLP